MKVGRNSFLALTIAAAVLAACTGASPSASTPASSAASASVAPSHSTIPAPTSLITAGKIVDCVDIEYPPLEYFESAGVTDPNAAIGFDVDAAKKVAALLGLQIEIRNTAFDALIPDLKAGRCDIVWTGLYVSAKRLEVADATPYMATGQVVMVLAGNPEGIKSVTDLCGKAVSIQTSGVVEQRINQASTDCTAGGKAAIQIAGYKQVADEFNQIVLGRVVAVWETDTAVLNWQFQYPGKYDVAYAMAKDDKYGVYYQKGKTDVGDAIAAALRALKADGTLTTLATQYKLDPTILDAIK